MSKLKATKSEKSISSTSEAKTAKKKLHQMATIKQTFQFIRDCGPGTTWLFAIGSVAAVLNGLVGPMICTILHFGVERSASFVFTEEVYEDMKSTSVFLCIVAFYTLIISFIQSVCFDIVGRRASKNLGRQWFHSLLRQDSAFFDVHDISGIANSVHPNCINYQNGIGKKFGEGIQGITSVIGGGVFAIAASWKIALMILGLVPVLMVLSICAVGNNRRRSSRSADAYEKAGGVAYTTISSIKTVFACNAAETMIQRYCDATFEAFKSSTSILIKTGLINGSYTASVVCVFVAISLFGPYILYTEVEQNGCDPSGGISDNEPCSISGVRITGTFLGFLFALEGMTQTFNPLELFIEARVAVRQALLAIDRKIGSPREIIYKENKTLELEIDKEGKNTIKTSPTSQTLAAESEEEDSQLVPVEDMLAELEIEAILPEFEIDSFSAKGTKPTEIQGRISFKNVCFSYPTRPSKSILNNFSLEIEAGKTVALVGPSGEGKSTVMSMIGRCYDPTSGIIELDGTNLKEINVPHLRGLIGYVGQEPTLFSTSIRKNIEFGCPGATEEQIAFAARMANADKFIEKFPDQYDTHVGNKGSQLSGGQKQRIAIARVLVGNPKILLLDEATSALDSESELVVQNAIDNILANTDMTTVIIAHRLSTIRNADMIAVVANNRIVETGTHAELMLEQDGWYKALVEEQEGTNKNDGMEKKHLELVQEGGGKKDESQKVINYTDFAEEEKVPEHGYDKLQEKEMSLLAMQQQQSQQQGQDRSTFSIHMYLKKNPSASLPSATRFGSITPHIHFENICFAYPTRKTRNIFDNLSLSVDVGETVAVVGPSGGGKSTLFALIERFYDPSEGVVSYMGHDIKTLNVRWYREQIGYVSQEPTLFNGTISSNISCGDPNITQEMIEIAAKQANAHDFVLSFPDGYSTTVGDRGTQLSGGQKQRIAIARALVKKPKVLLLDESTSALDSESEALVQATLDKLIATKERTIIIIAHRLSTVRNSDKIAFVSDGQVQELGSHVELMKLDGRYKRLVDAQKRSSTIESIGLSQINDDSKDGDNDDDGEFDENSFVDEFSLLKENSRKYFSYKRAIRMIAPEARFLLVGVIGSFMLGSLYPAWGILFAETVHLLFYSVYPCTDDNEAPEFCDSCQEYWDHSAAELRNNSYRVAMLWAFVVADCLLGSTLMKWGMGMARERLVKRMRDGCFRALLSQEVSFFDTNSIGTITSVLQEDTMKLYFFAGEPLFAVFFGVSSITLGIIAGLIFVWPVALVATLSVPFMGLGLFIKVRQTVGTDRNVSKNEENTESPGGIIAEALLNIRTVLTLTLESEIFESYRKSLHEPGSRVIRKNILDGLSLGFGSAFVYWIFACMIWFGSWVLYTYPALYSMLDLLRAVFGIYFSLFALGIALREGENSEAIKSAGGRVFFLQDHKSKIDSICKEGKKLA